MPVSFARTRGHQEPAPAASGHQYNITIKRPSLEEKQKMTLVGKHENRAKHRKYSSGLCSPIYRDISMPLTNVKSNEPYSPIAHSEDEIRMKGGEKREESCLQMCHVKQWGGVLCNEVSIGINKTFVWPADQKMKRLTYENNSYPSN